MIKPSGLMSNLDVVSSKQLDRLSAAQQNLILLRILFCEDSMTSLYQTLEMATVKDLLDCADGILQQDDGNEVIGDPIDYTYLTKDEKLEYLSLVESMRPYCEELEDV